MRASWEKLRGLEARDWAVLLRCLWTIPAVEWSVRFRRPRAWMPREEPRAATGGSEARAAAERVARLVDAVYRRLPLRPTCLTRSLVLYRILRARGIPCQLKIGVRKQSGELEGHAWTELALDEGKDYELILSF